MQVVLAQTTKSALLFTSASVNDETTDVDYTSCSLEKAFVVQGNLLDPVQLTETSGKAFLYLKRRLNKRIKNVPEVALQSG